MKPAEKHYLGAFYFFTFFLMSIESTFLALYFQSKGLTGGETGTLLAIGPICALALQPVWGLVADLIGSRKGMLTLILLASGVAFFAVSLPATYGWLVLSVATWAAFATAIRPTTDSITLAHIEDAGGEYGRFRLWGTMGYSVSSVLIGAIIDATSMSAIFAYYFAFAVLAAVISRRLPEQARPMREPLVPGLKALLLNRRLAVFLSFFLSLNILTVGGYLLFILYMEGMGADKGLIGIAVAIGACVEIPIFWVAGRLLRRTGPLVPLAVAVLLYSLRWLLYSVISQPELVLFVQPLHGICFALIWTASVTFVNDQAPPQLRTTGQALIGMAYGVASVIGMPLAGKLNDVMGAPAAFRLYSALLLVLFAVLVIEMRTVLKNSRAGHRA